MKQENIDLIKLTAAEGYVLTNGEAYGTVIYLGINDSLDNWREITQKEYDDIMNNMEV